MEMDRSSSVARPQGKATPSVPRRQEPSPSCTRAVQGLRQNVGKRPLTRAISRCGAPGGGGTRGWIGTRDRPKHAVPETAPLVVTDLTICRMPQCTERQDDWMEILETSTRGVAVAGANSALGRAEIDLTGRSGPFRSP